MNLYSYYPQSSTVYMHEVVFISLVSQYSCPKYITLIYKSFIGKNVASRWCRINSRATRVPSVTRVSSAGADRASLTEELGKLIGKGMTTYSARALYFPLRPRDQVAWVFWFISSCLLDVSEPSALYSQAWDMDGKRWRGQNQSGGKREPPLT